MVLSTTSTAPLALTPLVVTATLANEPTAPLTFWLIVLSSTSSSCALGSLVVVRKAMVEALWSVKVLPRMMTLVVTDAATL